MLFNSYVYLCAFLPLALLGYYALRGDSSHALAWLVLASLVFYGWWNPWHLPVIAGSIAVNFWIGLRILASTERKRAWLVAGIAVNLLLLGAFKYTHFAVATAAQLTGQDWDVAAIALPLGISFFTFTQIAYLVDTARGLVKEPNPLHYALFVTFFPHLLAGPIIHHGEMMPQFADRTNRAFQAENFARGLFLLAIGFGKKVLVADPLGETANTGYADIGALTGGGAWLATLAYTFQIYFDFSGYTDMALGAALMFNIRLPANFNSPYRAADLQDFWRRWHMTLSRFLRDYLYLPLGGNRGGATPMSMNLMATFLLGGLWHGAGWTFIVWGALHGAGLVALHAWRRLGLGLPRWAGIALTFLFVHLTWVFFRAPTLGDAFAMLHKLAPLQFDVQAFAAAAGLGLPYAQPGATVLVALAAVLCLLPRNSDALAARFEARPLEAAWTGVLLCAGVLTLGQVTQFLYFNF
ncbi:MAG: MBOAT family protein [Betaproteobacteria bacterium]|nr:MBOAT family protein [Betaproteobacteria bacterium]